eukprot:TRINITY_DN45548_c0_g1_i1.p1 TRINITY_DN45548_c0_g1~~TRINITY_DN45548_c0_g1_i1.p1  ORF type:complete len:490 (-),score=99.95 TRINITY_DN45548_c0_g1_i1:155-1624(-)
MAGEIVLAATTDDQGIFGTDLHSGAVVATFEESSAMPGAFGTIGGSGSHVFAAQAKKAMWHVWAWGERKPCYRASLPEKTTAMVFTSDAAFCIAGALSGALYVWQLGTGCLLRSWPAHYREVTQLTLSQDDCFLVSASADCTVHVYNLADILAEAAPRPLHTWSGHALSVTSLALPPGNGLQQTVVSASLDRTVRIWDVGSGKPVASHTLPSQVLSLVATPSGSEVVCACSDGELRAVGLGAAHGGSSRQDGGGFATYSGHSGSVLSCAVNADGSRLASCGEADRVRIWETRTRQCISQVHASKNVQIGAVRIVRRAADAPGLPAFQPFQRLLTAPEDAPSVPLCLAGRSEALAEELQARARSRDFIDKIVWSQASGLQGLAQAQVADERLQEAQQDRAKWASLAARLYEELAQVEEAGELRRPAAAAVPRNGAASVGPADSTTGAKSAEDHAEAGGAAVGHTATQPLPTLTAPPAAKRRKRRRGAASA